MKASKIIDVLSLYIGRSGGLVVGFIFLPLYQILLSTHDFGLVTLYLTCVAIAISFDFGLSVLFHRSAASGEFYSNEGTWNLFTVEISLVILFSIITAISCLFINSNLIYFGLLLSINIIFCVLQNILIMILLGSQKYTISGFIQGGLSLFKAIFSYLAVLWEPNIISFMAAQAVTSVIFYILTRYLLGSFGSNFYRKEAITISSVYNSFKSLVLLGLPLLMMSISGVIVLQADKVLVNIFMGLEVQSTYFLALSVSMLPLTIMSAPVFQYFQPKVIKDIDNNQALNLNNNIKFFMLSIFIVSVLPSMLLWVYRTEIISLWLHDPDVAKVVIEYVTYLLPGTALGCVGYVPLSILMGLKKYSFQAKASIVMTVITVLILLFFSYEKEILAICILYSCYHTISVFVNLIGSTGSDVCQLAIKSIFKYYIFQIIIVLMIVFYN
ncbi:lipopolysaccharide biosynthesis protein [Vibrio tapetis]|uniref:Polysaccharide biosynthesis protein n=1 Tax=Vibrio tapetis subsp. tapetis TaxID=1671868 RepID=A0A2N8ZGH0_9VIBR|nr:oligosaccharide flippase family protein [Vibrio tapetis]SON51010.1 conserved membrane protein of unknown function [Vibrio tapetis subsp. tapetis]